MKPFFLTVLNTALGLSQLFAQNTLPPSIQPYAVHWSYSVKQMLESGGLQVPGPHAEFQYAPQIQTRSNELQLDSTISFYGYNENTPDSTPLLKNVYTYPQPEVKVVTEYFHDTDHWTALSRTTLVSDDDGRLVDAFAELYEESTGEFVPDSKIKMFPRGNSEDVDSFFVYAWSRELNDYVRQLVVWNSFDNEERLTESLSAIEIFEFPILFVDRYNYNTDGDLSLVESFTLDGLEEIAVSRQEFWYQDHLVTTATTLVSEGPNGFVAEAKIEYKYTSSGKKEVVQNYAYDLEKNDWKLLSVDAYEYDAEGRVSAEENVTDEEGIWMRHRKTLEYVSDEDLSRESDYTYNNNLEKWVLEENQYYYYNELTAVDPEDPIVADAVFLWPNPTSGVVQVKLTGKISVHVYTISGQFVQKFYLAPGEKMIDLSLLPAGIYQVMAKSDEDYYSGKLIIQ